MGSEVRRFLGRAKRKLLRTAGLGSLSPIDPSATDKMVQRIARLGASHEDLDRLIASNLGDSVADYNLFMYRTLGVAAMHPTFPYGTNFGYDSELGKPLAQAAYKQIVQLAKNCYDLVVQEQVPGALVEFGVAQGWWLNAIVTHMEETGNIRECWGFDSFEGLPEPDPIVDGPDWRKGQYAADKEAVEERLRVKERPFVHLVQGWFSDTLKAPEAQGIKEIAYAKVDCDLFHPSVECLDYVTGRLSNGAILMFDDWTHLSNAGETKAFIEWIPTVPQYRFELIGFFNFRIYFRVFIR